MRVTVRLPDDWDLDAISSSVGGGFNADRSRTVRVSFLDTFDWRVAAAGCRLTDEVSDGVRSLRWQDASGAPAHVLPLSCSVRFARDLPDSVLRNRLESLAGIRALLAVGELRVERRSCRVRDAGGNTAVLLHLERTEVVDSSGAATGEVVTCAEVQGIPGFESDFDGVVRLLGGRAGCPDLLELAAGARGRSVGDYSSKLDLRLDGRQRSDEALRSILLHLLSTLEANVDGVIADHDTEFLHDLRVATRRTRAALAQLKGVLPASEVGRFGDEFRWLGALTGPCRDLDVYLLEMDTFHRLTDDPPDMLDPLRRAVEQARAAAFRDVRTGLRSARFRRLLERWGAYLRSDTAGGDGGAPEAGRPIAELSAEKILRAYRRMTKHIRRLGDDPPPDALHRLRIDGKKLRYLLEFFRSLFPAREVEELIRELKQVQDVLGAVNDLRVQQDRLVDFARGLARAGEVETVLAMGRLSAALRQRQDELRLESLSAAAAFASPERRSHYCELFGGRTV